jgi:hypothetical protein
MSQAVLHATPGDAPGASILGRTPSEWLVSFPTIVLLLLVLVISTGELIHGRLLAGGETLFGDPAKHVQYYALRADPVKPTCNAHINVDEEVQKRVAAQASQPKDALDDIFASNVGPTADQLRRSLTDSLAECQFKHDFYNRAAEHITPGVVAYRTLETSFFGLFRFGAEHRSMILLLLMGVVILASTVEYEHIGLVPVRNRRDYLVQSWTTLLAGGFMLWSALSYYQISSAAGVEMERPEHQQAWIVMFAAMVVVSVWQLFNQPKHAPDVPDGSWNRALQSAPIGGTLAIWAGVYFALHNHPSGLAIYINTLMEVPNLPLQLALFIWGGRSVHEPAAPLEALARSADLPDPDGCGHSHGLHGWLGGLRDGRWRDHLSRDPGGGRLQPVRPGRHSHVGLAGRGAQPQPAGGGHRGREQGSDQL